ncbi:MAG: DUF3857 domain-containing protein [Acidobacteria bacterium]|nr:DUF3857 domain-containing protein [Acidobacteriota bacterium]
MSVVVLAFALLPAAPCIGQSSSASPAVDYSVEPIVVEKFDTVYRFAVDGTGTREMTTVARIQSDAAARQYGVLSFPFAGSSGHVEFDYVRVRKADGSVVETPASDAQEVPLEVTRQAPFYSDLKEKQIPVRNLRMGDKLEYKVRIVDTKAEAPGQFWGQDTFGLWAVILNESIELHVPKAKYVKVWSPTVQPAKTESGDETVYRWTGSQMEPLAGKDSKLKHREIDPKGELPTIAWTTFKSWEDVGAWYRGLEADRAVPDASIKAKVGELTAGNATEEEKAHALYSYVATQIRYIGVAFGVGRYQPHPAAEVLRNQYGDCKDKHTLLAAMLTAAGLNPSASLIGAGVRLNPDVPSPSAFNHLITMVPLRRKDVWLDTTAEVAPWGMLVAATRDKETLVVPDTGAAKLEKTPQALPFTPFSRFAAKGTLSKEGVMKSQMEYTARGDDELVLRTLLRQVSPGQWDDLSQRLSQAMGFGGTTSHTEAGRPDKTDEPARISYDYEREKFGDWDNHRIVPLFPVIYLGNVDDKYPPQKQPIQLGEPHVETATSVIKLPAGWGAEPPAAVHQKTPWITLDKTYKIEGDTLASERRMEVLQREIPASEWKAYKKWYDAAIGDGETYITLIGTETKSAIGPVTSAMPKKEIGILMRTLYEQTQRGEVIAAEQSLGQIQKLEPDSIWYYRGLMQIRAVQGKPEEAADALRHILKTNEALDPEKKAGAELFYGLGNFSEALPLLEAQSTADPENETMKLHLGISQLKTGSTALGTTTLLALLDKTTEEATMNSAAYELAEENVQLDKAEKAARGVVDTLTTESTSWVVSDTTDLQKKRQSLLVASWDTLGWIFFREGKLAEAENYVRAAWNNQQVAEVGLHLGEIEEALDHRTAALSTYDLAIASIVPETLAKPSALTKANKNSLQNHIDTLRKQGIGSQPNRSSAGLMKLRTIQLSSWSGPNSMSQYTFVVQQDRIGDLQQNIGATISGGAEKVRKAVLSHWVPTGSEARLLRRGTLNCHSNTCELMIHPMMIWPSQVTRP